VAAAERGFGEVATVTSAETFVSWNEGPSESALVDFVTRVTTTGDPHFVPPIERIAVFDNDGTLWCEKRARIRLCECAEQSPDLATAQGWTTVSIKNDWKAVFQ
jgi:hypothetical protein